MASRNLYLAIVLCMAAIIVIAGPVAAQDLNSISVLSTTLVESIYGVDGSGLTWEDSQTAMGMVVEVVADIPEDMLLWAPDFNIAYLRGDGREDRGRCKGLTSVVSLRDDDGVWVIDDYAKVSAKQGTRYFKLLFPIENDVEAFNIQFTHTITKQKVPVNRD